MLSYIPVSDNFATFFSGIFNSINKSLASWDRGSGISSLTIRIVEYENPD